jgi:hypothetical protein
MLYNIEKRKIKDFMDCMSCPCFEKGRCKGIGKVCFEYDKKTQTIVDPITKMPIKLK